MQALAAQRPPPQHVAVENNVEHEDENDRVDHPFAGQIQYPVNFQRFNDQWEQGFKSELPEFHDGSTAEELLDRIITVEEVLEFK